MIQIHLQRHDPQATLEASASATRLSHLQPFGEDGLTFGDVLDVINPLHHIPILGTVYRKLTGDTIDPAIRVAGGALFGGPIGAAFSAAAVAFGAIGKAPAALAVEPGQQLALQAETRSSTATTTTTATTARRGGWIVNAGRPAAVNDTQPVNDTDARRLSQNTGHEVRRGGWIVNAGRPAEANDTQPVIDTDARHLSQNTGRQVRRGGWMVAQAYGPIAESSSSEGQNKQGDKLDLAV